MMQRRACAFEERWSCRVTTPTRAVWRAIGAAIPPVLLFLPASTFAHAQPWPDRVAANYRVHFAGIDIGRFNYDSHVSKGQYRLIGDTVLEIGFGAFKWHSVNKSSGTLNGDTVKPAAYSFTYKSSKSSGSTDLTFDANGVSAVKLVPERDDNGFIPIKPEHLKQVFDPMSALVALSRAGPGDPCSRRISVFDGKRRFDLVMSNGKQRRISEKRTSGLPLMAYVCNVKYIPVSGHKMNKETKALARNSGIEVTLRPIPAARLAVPISIKVPLSVGTVEVRARRVEIFGPGGFKAKLEH